MSQRLNTELTNRVGFILDHLQSESDYLDVVIECSLKVKEILSRFRRKSVANAKPVADESPSHDLSGSSHTSQVDAVSFEPIDAGAPDTPSDPIQELYQLREYLVRQACPLQTGRQHLAAVRQELAPILGGQSTLSKLARCLEEPARSQLIRLRQDLLKKINEVRAINIGNQAVLIYSINFYDRLLSALTNENATAPCYGANGEIQKSWGGNILQTDC